MNMQLVYGYFLTLPLLYCAFPMHVAGAGALKDDHATTWGLGGGVLVKETAYEGYDRETLAIPIVLAENRWLRLVGPDLDIKLGATGPVEFALRAKFAFGDGYKSSDAPILHDMHKRKASVWVGPSLTWKNEMVDISLEALGDSMGNSKGEQASVELSRTFHIGQRYIIEPSVTTTWRSKKYVDYYYGVEATEARMGRSFYEGEDTVVVDADVRFAYGFDQHHSISLVGGVTYFDREIEDSPLIDRNTEGRVALIYLYLF